MKRENDERIETPTDEGSDAETLRQTVTRLESEWAAMNGEYERLCASRLSDTSAFGAWQPDSPRLAFLRATIPGLRSKIDALHGRVKLVDATESFRRDAETSPERAETARALMAEAKHRAAELAGRADTLKQRAEALRAESAAAEARVVENETAAAQVYAGAISSGNSKAEKAAQTDLQKAQSESLSAGAKTACDARVIAALELEAEALTEQSKVAREEAEEHRREMFLAIVSRLQNEWDGAVRALVEIGARLTAVHRHLGYSAGLRDLRVPRFNPAASWNITERELSELAGEISDDLLIEEASSE